MSGQNTYEDSGVIYASVVGTVERTNKYKGSVIFYLD
jgi:exosome complex RNA-binding protein Rrp4